MAAESEPKPQPYTFDLGHLLCNDTNPLPPLPTESKEKEAILSSTARDCAQSLISQLLTTCPITKATDDGTLQIKLPEPTTLLPREKPVPKDKEKSRWQKFADKKGIQPKKREGKLVYDEAKGDWVPRYGYKGKKDGQEDWLVEVDEKQEREGKKAKAKAKGNDGREDGGPRKRVKKGR